MSPSNFRRPLGDLAWGMVASGLPLSLALSCSSMDSSCNDGACPGAVDSSSSAASTDSSTTATTGQPDTTADEGEPDTTATADTTDPPQCREDADCPMPGDVCDPSGACVDCYEGIGVVGCDDDPDAAGPLCIDNACVECEDGSQCGGEALCNPKSHECLPCTAHADCTVGACVLSGDDAGRCFADDAIVVHVDDDPPPPDATGTYVDTVQEAVAIVQTADYGVVIVHPGGGAYAGPVGITEGTTVAMIGQPDATGTAPAIAVSGGVALTVTGESTAAYLADLRLIDSATGLRVDDATMHARRLRIGNNAQAGIRAEGAAGVVLEGTRVVSNAGSPGGAEQPAGVRLRNSAALVATNVFVGGSAANVPALRLEDDAVATMSHTTIGAGYGPEARVVQCFGASSIELRKSAVFTLGTSASVVCESATFESTATEFDGAGVVNVGEFAAAWFLDGDQGDFALTPEGAAALSDISDWQRGDPVLDIDGDRRPTEAGAPDYPGADVPSAE